MARIESQLNIAPMEVPNRAGTKSARTNREHESDGRRHSVGQQPTATAEVTNDSQLADPVCLASFLFDQALRDAGMTTAEAAHLIGVSENFINRMRSPNYKECVSLLQLIKCGPVVLWKFHRALHAKCHFGRQALGEAVQALSLIGVGIE